MTNYRRGSISSARVALELIGIHTVAREEGGRLGEHRAVEVAADRTRQRICPENGRLGVTLKRPRLSVPQGLDAGIRLDQNCRIRWRSKGKGMRVEARVHLRDAAQQWIILCGGQRANVVVRELLVALVDIAAEYLGEQLSTKADAKHGQILSQGVFDCAARTVYRRIVIDRIGEPGQHDQAVIARHRGHIVEGHVRVELGAGAVEPVTNSTESFVDVVLHDENAEGGAMLAHCGRLSATARVSSMKTCCVIGAGVAGLTAADSLAQSGVEVVVLEARDRVGGRVWSDRLEGGGLVERGAEFITAGYDATDAMVERLGLAYAGMGIRYPDRALRPDPGIDRAEALRVAGLVEAAAAAAGADAMAIDILDAVVEDARIRELLASRAQSASSVALELLPAERLRTIGHLLDDGETRRVVGGNQQLALRLAEGLGAAVRLSTPVLRIEHGPNGVRVHTADDVIEADACIVAVPLAVTEQIAFDPPLSSERRAAMAAIPIGQAAKLAVPADEPVAAAAIMSTPGRFWAYASPCDEVGGTVVGSWAGATPVLDLLEVDEGSTVWAREIRALWPELPALDIDAASMTVWRSDREWTGGSYSAVTGIPDDRDRHPIGDAIGRLAFAGEHTAPRDWTATIEGAIRSGQRAAEDILDTLGDAQ